jgi:hypothetical protein
MNESFGSKRLTVMVSSGCVYESLCYINCRTFLTSFVATSFAGMTRVCGLTYRSPVDIRVNVVFHAFQYAPEAVVRIEDVSLCSEIERHLPLIVFTTCS